MNIVVTWMYSSPDGESIHHAQTGSDSGSQEVKNYYWRCVFLLFESSARLNVDTRHILFVNKMPPVEIDGKDIYKLIQQYSIEVHVIDNVTVSPKNYFGSWNSQFVIIDILEQLVKMIEQDDIVMILDSDIIFNKPISKALEGQVKSEKALLLTIEYEPKYNINGLSRVDLAQISKEIEGEFPVDEFVYSGGEFVCCLGAEISKIAGLARKTYQTSLDRHERGLKKFNEEAHLLSFVYHVLGYMNGTANQYIKRIWTNRLIYCNVDGFEKDLILWHLPAEKKRGFVEVFKKFEFFSGGYRLETKDLVKKFRIKEPIAEKINRCYSIYKRKILKQIGF